MVLVLAIDFGVGWAWQSATSTQSRQERVSNAIGVSTGRRTDLPVDPREKLPALASSPWIHQWFQEGAAALRYYVPYLLYRNAPYRGRCLNIEGGVRRSYQTAGVRAGTAPEVAFLGGSTTYGVAQRDQHTIASEVARLAEADGLPIIARNYGVSGWVNWQEMLPFEQLAANPTERPDIALFYDGANEVTAQTFGLVGEPSHVALDEVEAALDDDSLERNRNEATAAVLQVQFRDLLRTYQQHSASGQLFRWARSVIDNPAGASPTQEHSPTSEEAQVSVDVYRRGRELILHIADTYDVPVLLFWQPRGMYESERAVMDQIDEPTINFSGVLDGHQDVFIDGNDHNEEGSRIVAAAIWEHLQPKVAAWYNEHE